MLNKKSLLYGLGCGLIAGALLLQLMNSSLTPRSSSVQDGPKPEEMSRQQLKEAASAYYQVYEKDQKLYTQAQLDATLQQKLKEEKEKQPSPASPPAQTASKETYIFISKGLTAGNVADLLQQSGVISDRKMFEDAMAAKQLNDKIVAGVHVFKGTLDLNQVLINITSQ
ncbi:hypothetical protein [Paenibacillus rigui]|uniref:Endolytic transglycosylase MltG n=1 Tax=Paenibacillus rigui TaxID=554312 RepID=A0A229UMJ8_9BACL|nr:hypothetical protein [Paenibacillus rigui]OXM84697.1 hypothetical protein CF651_19530 [Paenibacillus rigui]